MNRLRCFLTMVALATSSLLARADASDFKFEILDPPTGPYLQYVNDSSPIVITFGSVCPTVSVPATTGADGCSTVYNNSTTTFSSFVISFDNYSSTVFPTDFYNYLNGQPAFCDTSPSTTAFTVASCGLSADLSRYNLLFSGGRGFYPGEYIVLAEFGASPDAFRNATATALTAVSPEPASVWLMVSGAAAVMFLAVKQRRGLAFGSALRS